LKVIHTADGSPTLFSERYNESFHSTFGAATESRYVFLETSGVTERLKTGQSTRVLEIGFGLGLNALLSCDLAISTRTPLEYHAFEHDYNICQLNQRIDFAQLLEKPELAETLQAHLRRVTLPRKALDTELTQLAAHPDPTTSQTPIEIATHTPCSVVEFCPTTTLNLHWGDVTKNKVPQGKFDAIYLDAFSPENNPECWTLEFFKRLKPLLASHTKLSTYCAKGDVRRALIAAGYRVSKLPGPPGKREIMLASLPPDE